MVAQLKGRILALDVGDRRVGVAVSDELGLLPRPLEIVDRRRVNALARVKELADAHNVQAVVVGLPKDMLGTEGKQAQRCRDFAAQLQELLPGTPVILWDERLSTKQALGIAIETRSKSQRRRESLDALSACVILQSYLDFLRSSPSENIELPNGQE